MDIYDVFASMPILVIALIIWHGHNLKLVALAAAANRCKKLDLQLLDQAISFKGFRRYKTQDKKPVWYRAFEFEFATTGEQRYKGEVRLVRGKVEGIELEPHALPTIPVH